MKIFTTSSKGRSKGLLTKGLVLFLWLMIWQALYLFVGQEVLIASPAQSLKRLLVLAQEGDFWLSAGNSLLRVLTGFALALLAGALLAVLTAVSSGARAFFTPAVMTVKATPVVSFIILALVWLDRDQVSIFISFLMVLPLVWINLSQGIARTDRALLEMGALYRFSFLKMVRTIYLPSVMPYFIAAFSTGLGLAWKAGIAAEVIGIPQNSIGQHLYNAKIYLETADLFAWTALVIVMSMAAEYTLVNLIQQAGKKYHVEEKGL